MKQLYALITIMLLASSCSPKESTYPNTTTSQIFSQLTWGLNYAAVNNILTNVYKLKYAKEIKQEDSTLVYEFTGGRYNNIDTKTWVVCFVHDSLCSIGIRISRDRKEDIDALYDQLCHITDKEFQKDSASTKDEQQWYSEKNGARSNNVLISKMKYFPNHPEINEIAILISKGSM